MPVGAVSRLQSAQPLFSERADVKRFGVHVEVFIIWDVCSAVCGEAVRRHDVLDGRCSAWGIMGNEVFPEKLFF